ncbi:hypothetical protein [Pseudoduganella sp. R-34]|uniref:hypothetical protein n=1 Tax=Pseudoduganella sp. R-34 TaxID=3404062 RepID=UPI003CF9E4FF
MLVTQIKGCPEDFLVGRELTALEIHDYDGKVVALIAATAPWTPLALFETVEANQELIDDTGVADFYLGDLWIGSTEL